MGRNFGWLCVTITISVWLGCDTSRIPGFWQTYSHPTHRFSLKAPRTWEIKQDAAMGSAVVLLAGEKDAAFRPNVNVVVQPRREQISLKEHADRSSKHLTILFNKYRLLGQSPTSLGSMQAIELRGRYYALEGTRIVRTVIALTQETQYVFTFTAREEDEKSYLRIFDGIRRSFKASQR